MEENKRSKLPIIIGIIILVSCIGIVGIGIGSFQLFRNITQDLFADIQNIPSIVNDQDLPINIPDINEDTPTATPWNEELPKPDPELAKTFETIWTARQLLKDNFLEQPIDDNKLAEGAIIGMETYLETFEISLSEVILPDEAVKPEDTAAAANTPQDAFDAFLPFWQIWNKLDYVSLPEEVDQTALMRKALQGMVEALDDPYTNYFDPELSERWNTQLSGEYEGIGAWVDVETEFLTIISPIKNTPAERAGLRPGDQIIAVDGNDMTGVDPNVVLKRVVGPAGSKVILTIQREGGEAPFDVEIIRERIEIPYLEYEMLDNDIAYIQLLRFSDNTDRQVEQALKTLLKENPKGLIFDLRGNPGGYLYIVVNITSQFIEDGNILIEEFNDGSLKEYPVHRSGGVATDIPLVVLVDQGSASASEIFAGAVKDYERGTVVGATTFGKGLVQLPITLPNEQGMISITIARWLTPNGETIHESGIEPDVVVEYTEEDINADIDPQLEKAIEILSSVD